MTRTSQLKRSALTHGLLLIALGATGACGEEEVAAPPPPPPAAAAAPTSPSATEQKAAEEKPAAVYAYSPIGKRDPFHSYIADLKEGDEDRTQRKPVETQKYELDQYRLTGVITGTAQPKAMVEDPTGRGHVLKIGSWLGKNGGRVTRITKAGIIVTEEFRAPTGERIRVPITVKLPQPDAGLLTE